MVELVCCGLDDRGCNSVQLGAARQTGIDAISGRKLAISTQPHRQLDCSSGVTCCGFRVPRATCVCVKGLRAGTGGRVGMALLYSEGTGEPVQRLRRGSHRVLVALRHWSFRSDGDGDFCRGGLAQKAGCEVSRRWGASGPAVENFKTSAALRRCGDGNRRGGAWRGGRRG